MPPHLRITYAPNMLYFGRGGPDNLLDDAGSLPYGEDKDNDADGEIIGLLDNEEGEDVRHRKGPFIKTFVDAGRPTGDVEHYQEYLQHLIENPIKRFKYI